MVDDAADARRVPEGWLNMLELVIDEAIEREGGIRLDTEDLRVDVPLEFGDDAERAEWGFDGSVTVETEGTRGTLAEWYHLHRESLPDPHGNGKNAGTPRDDANR
ncbi:hypothetical protein [Halobaculum limi]|uniref:hypothetical protein n=1 Tax=Halobaculum limi TaxID=3031916 RepID=UPI002404F8F0|nr:hypothetical protein [Halobaculum sp. YSMS11]